MIKNFHDEVQSYKISNINVGKTVLFQNQYLHQSHIPQHLCI